MGDSPGSNRVNALLFDAGDNLWLATDDVWFEMENEIIQVVRGRVIKYGPEDEVCRHRVVSVTEDRQGRILVANEGEVFEFVAPPDGK